MKYICTLIVQKFCISCDDNKFVKYLFHENMNLFNKNYTRPMVRFLNLWKSWDKHERRYGS